MPFLDPKVIEQAHDIERHLPAILLCVVRLVALAVPAAVDRDDPIVLSQARDDRGPILNATISAVDEDNGFTGALLDVVDPGPICIEEAVRCEATSPTRATFRPAVTAGKTSEPLDDSRFDLSAELRAM